MFVQPQSLEKKPEENVSGTLMIKSKKEISELQKEKIAVLTSVDRYKTP